MVWIETQWGDLYCIAGIRQPSEQERCVLGMKKERSRIEKTGIWEIAGMVSPDGGGWILGRYGSEARAREAFRVLKEAIIQQKGIIRAP